MKANIHFDWKKIWPHAGAILVFFILSFLYFAPVVLGEKDMGQGDVHSWFGSQQESRLCYEQTGERTDWSNVAFGGMPTVGSEGTNIYKQIFPRVMMGGLPVLNAGILFFYMIGVYILLCVLGCRPWLSVIGAIAYAFATYNVVIIDAGHVNKCWAMATMAPILAGVILCFKGKYLWGALLTLVFTGMHIMYSHQQITYYLLIMLVVLAIAYGIDAYRQKQMKTFWKGSVLALGMAVISLLPSLGGWLVTYDYSKDTMRGGAVLKQNPQGENEGTGLERDYAFQWSYGKMESMTLLIPQFYGGSSHYTMPDDSETNQLLRQSGQQASMLPMYWGDQPFTSGPVYVGAIICLLFVLGLFVVKGPVKWWLLVVTVISLVLSWGRHLAWLNDFLFDYLPLYNRFRTPSMALIIAELSMVILAVLALKVLFSESRGGLHYKKDLFYAAGIAGGICLIFALFGRSMFGFSAVGDAQYPPVLQDSLRADRASLLVSSAWRSLVFVLLAGVLIWMYMKKSVKDVVAVGLLAGLVFADMWTIDRKYVGEQNFYPKRAARAVIPNEADMMILNDPELKAHPDPDYRVFNATVNTFNDASTSNFHKSIGGYSPMKLRRYQDVIDYHFDFQKGVNFKVLNMLNTRYFIVPDRQGQPAVQRNVAALGHAWFVDSVRWVNSPDEEIEALYDFDPARTAIIDTVWREKVGSSARVYPALDTASYVRMTYYQPNHLKYEYRSSVERPLVFSEVYYKTWRAFVDGQEVPLYQVNYILRGLTAPAGEHVVELKCRNKIKAASGWMTNTGSIINGLLILALVAMLIWKPQSRKSTIGAGMDAEQASTGKE